MNPRDAHNTIAKGSWTHLSMNPATHTDSLSMPPLTASVHPPRRTHSSGPFQPSFGVLKAAVVSEADPTLRDKYEAVVQGFSQALRANARSLTDAAILLAFQELSAESQETAEKREKFLRDLRGPLPIPMPLSELGNAKDTNIIKSPKDTYTWYERGKRIGQGGFGTVYLGIRRKAGSQDSQVVAIKTITGKFAITALDEQAIMIRTEGHPNFLQVFDCALSGKLVRKSELVMEYFDGRDLRDWMEFYDSFSQSLVKHIAREALTGLAYLHEGTTPGFIHRDISMGNIIMSTNFTVKIIDYGCAIPVTKRDHDFNYGIPFFRAPEILNEQLWTTAADIWSLGMVLLFTTRPNSHILTNESGQRVKESCMEDLHGIPGGMGDFFQKILTESMFTRPSARLLLSHSWIQAA